MRKQGPAVFYLWLADRDLHAPCQTAHTPLIWGIQGNQLRSAFCDHFGQQLGVADRNLIVAQNDAAILVKKSATVLATVILSATGHEVGTTLLTKLTLTKIAETKSKRSGGKQEKRAGKQRKLFPARSFVFGTFFVSKKVAKIIALLAPKSC